MKKLEALFLEWIKQKTEGKTKFTFIGWLEVRYNNYSYLSPLCKEYNITGGAEFRRLVAHFTEKYSEEILKSLNHEK